MKGIRIYNGVTKDVNEGGTPVFVHESLRNGCSDFSVYFQPLIDCSTYNWAFKNCPDLWQLPWEWFEEESDKNLIDKPGSKVYEIYNSGYRIRIPEDGKLADGYEYEGKIYREYSFAGIFENEFVKKYAAYIKDDWNDLFAISPSCPNTQELLEFIFEEKVFTAEKTQEIVDENVEWYFCNFDGLFWQFFSKSDDDLQLIKTHLKNYKTVTYEEIPVFDIRKVNLKYSSPPKLSKEKMEEIQSISKKMEDMILKMFEGLADEKE